MSNEAIICKSDIKLELIDCNKLSKKETPKCNKL